jgi:hypothetical protein
MVTCIASSSTWPPLDLLLSGIHSRDFLFCGTLLYFDNICYTAVA